MKKAAAFLVAASLLCTLAFTARGRVAFEHNPAPCSDPSQGDPDHSNAWGSVQFSHYSTLDPDEIVRLQVQVLDAAPEYEYYVVFGVPYYEFGTFQTNRSGNGNFRFSMTVSDLIWGNYDLEIWESPKSGDEGQYGCPVLWTTPYVEW